MSLRPGIPTHSTPLLAQRPRRRDPWPPRAAGGEIAERIAPARRGRLRPRPGDGRRHWPSGGGRRGDRPVAHGSGRSGRSRRDGSSTVPRSRRRRHCHGPYSHRDGRGPGVDRCADRAPEPALLRRVRRAARAPPPGGRRRRHPDDRHRPVQGAQRHATATPTGDEVLRAVAAAIVAAVREDDVPARFGGEEFVVLLRNPEPGGRGRGRRADPRGRRARLDLRRFGVPAVSVSVGVAVATSGRADRRADRRRPTGPSTGPSGRAATGWSPRRLGDPAPARLGAPRYHRRHASPRPSAAPPDSSRRHQAAVDSTTRRRRPRRRPRRRRRRADPKARLTNGDLARIFHDIGDMLEVKGELVFKTVAYHRAADAIGRSPIDLVAAYRAGDAAHDPRRRHRRSATRSPSSSRPAGWPTTTSCAPRSRRASSSCCASRASVRRPSASSTASSASRRSTTSAQAAEAGTLRDAQGPVGQDRGAHPRGHRARSRRPPQRMLLHRRRGDDRRRSSRLSPTRPASATIEPAGSFRRKRETHRRPRPARRDRRRPGAHRALHDGLGVVDQVVNQGGYKAAVAPAARAAGRPDGHAARRRRHVPDPLHRARRNTTSGSASVPATGLEPVREGLPAHRRGRRAADRRRRRAPDVRHRGRGLRLPRPAVHRARAARGRGRDRGGPGRPPAAPDHARRPARRPAQPLGLVRRPSIRSRSWPRPPAAAATPTRS